jgi:hypothetical protein
VPDNLTTASGFAPRDPCAVGGGAMAISSRRAGAPSLRKPIEAFTAERNDHLDKAALNLLARLAISGDAAKAVQELKMRDQRHMASILEACVETEQLYRTFPQRITEAERTLEQTERLENAASMLRKFVEEVAKRKEPSAFDVLSARVREPGDNIVAMKHGLLLVTDRIRSDQRVAEETKLRLGATRKTGTIARRRRSAPPAQSDARRVAAVGWLGDAVQHITGEPHRPQVAKLANVILGSDTVTKDQVYHATLTRKREWRLPLGRAFARKK